MTVNDDREDPPELRTVEPGYVNVIRVRTLLAWAPLIVAAVVFDRAVLDDSSLQGALLFAVPLLALIATLTAPQRIWARLRYALHPSLLQVLRGWLFHSDTMVPFVRVQHVDIRRGPLDKLFGTASLVVHTAGTHNSIVTLPGLSPERAGEVRELIRGTIRSDLD